MTELTRNTVLKMIRERIGQAVVLTHHLKNNTDPFESYIHEKTQHMPSLDTSNRAVFDTIASVLFDAYSVEIEYRNW